MGKFSTLPECRLHVTWTEETAWAQQELSGGGAAPTAPSAARCLSSCTVAPWGQRPQDRLHPSPARPTCYLVSYAQTSSPPGALEFSSTVVMGNSSLHICRQDLLSLQN